MRSIGGTQRAVNSRRSEKTASQDAWCQDAPFSIVRIQDGAIGLALTCQAAREATCKDLGKTRRHCIYASRRIARARDPCALDVYTFRDTGALRGPWPTTPLRSSVKSRSLGRPESAKRGLNLVWTPTRAGAPPLSSTPPSCGSWRRWAPLGAPARRPPRW
jgi:hypothetical protein